MLSAISRDAVGGVGEELGEEWPVEGGGLVGARIGVEELRDARRAVELDVLRHVERGEFGAGAGVVVEGLPVEDVAEVAALLVSALFLVEALLGFIA